MGDNDDVVVEEFEPVIQNTTPSFISDLMQNAIAVLESYGWFLLIGGVILLYLYSIYKPKFDKWKQQQQDWKDMEEAKKNPEKAHKIQMSMEEARLKLQQRITVDAERKKQQQLQKEEEERKRKIEEWEKHQSGGGYHSKWKAKVPEQTIDTNNRPKPKKSTFKRQEFNALSGSGGGSCSYRPSSSGRRSGGG